MFRVILHRKFVPIFFLLSMLLVLGVVLFMLLEDWSFIDALYFTVSTMTTVGYGDISPSHDGSKLVAVVYMLVMIPIMFVSLGAIADSVMSVKAKAPHKRRSSKRRRHA